jgi:hypothetical protein
LSGEEGRTVSIRWGTFLTIFLGLRAQPRAWNMLGTGLCAHFGACLEILACPNSSQAPYKGPVTSCAQPRLSSENPGR